MPDNPNSTPIQSAWLGFTDSLRVIIVPRPDDRPLDQYLRFRDDVFALVEGPDFLSGLQSAWTPFTDVPLRPLGDLLLAELHAYPLAMEVAQMQEKAGGEDKGWISKWLGRASTITGSEKICSTQHLHWSKAA
jgi:hypothetical protein